MALTTVVFINALLILASKTFCTIFYSFQSLSLIQSKCELFGEDQKLIVKRATFHLMCCYVNISAELVEPVCNALMAFESWPVLAKLRINITPGAQIQGF